MTTLELAPSAPVNLRDLGGIPVAGGPLATGLAIRTDDLSLIDTATADDLVTVGVRTVIDLRTVDEAQLTGRGPLQDRAVAHHHLPLMRSVDTGLPQGGGFTHAQMGEMYVRMVEDAAPQLATALSIIALSPGTTAFHCSAGRDRTGVLAALLLVALGASDAEIIADYTRTEVNMPAVNRRMGPVMRVLLGRLGFDLEQLTGHLAEGSMSESMALLLARLRSRYGDPLIPVRVAGLGEETIARLRARACG